MKVFIVNLFLSRQGGGIFTVLKELYNSKTSRKYFKDELTFLGYNEGNAHEDVKLLNGNSFLFDKNNPFYYSRKFKNTIKEISEESVILHLHTLWMYPSLLFSSLKQKSHFIKVISPHGMLDKWALNNGSFKKKICLFLFERKNINSANCLHALCYQEYLDIRSVSKTVPVAIIPNGITLPKNAELQYKKEKNILFLARLHPKKGLDNLIKAWGEVDTKNWNLIIVGPDEGGYEMKIKKRNSTLEEGKNKIKFMGSVFGDQKRQLYTHASMFVLPSYSEGLPMTILEAWSYKLPVLMTSECNLNIGFEREAAIKITSTVEGIAQGLDYSINVLKESDLMSIGANGYELVRHEFTWDQISMKMINMYNWTLGKISKPNFIHLD